MKSMSKLLLLVGCATWLFEATPSTAADTNVVAPEAIVHDLGIQKARAAYLLAFSARVDERPLYVEDALVAVEFVNRRWRLVHAYRHPNEPKPEYRCWWPHIVNDAPVISSRDFKRQPTETQVDDFLIQSDWRFGAFQGGFRLIRGEVYSGTWQKALGYKPRYEYPKPSA
jgi:hypothetical protein